MGDYADGKNSNDPTDLSQGNYGVWAFRGKRYETMMKDEGEEPTGGNTSV